MNNNPFLRIIILSSGMLITTIAASLVVILIKTSDGIPITMNYEDPLVLAGIMVAVSSIPAGLFLFKTYLNKAKQLETLDEKLQNYQMAVIIRHALWEGAALLNVVAFWNSPSWISIIGLSIIILLFLIFMPSATRIKNDLEI